MRDIKFLHLFPDLMNSSHDAENLSFAAELTREMGYFVTITRSDDPFELTDGGYNIVYIADGSDRGLVQASQRFCRAGTKTVRAIDAGQTVFAAGSARLLFGHGFVTQDGKIGAGIGAFDYSGAGESTAVISRNVSTPVFDSSEVVIGNLKRRFSIIGQNRHPLFNVISGEYDGKERDGFEGTLYKNFFGTWQCDGAVLAENPCLMRELLRRGLGVNYREVDFTLATEAHNELLAGVRARV